MRLRWSIFLIIFIYILGIIFTFVLFDIKTDSDLDIVAINQIVKTTEKNWGHLHKEDYSDLGQRFVVLDTNENILFSTSNNISSTIYAAIKKRDTIVDLDVDGQIVGKIIFSNNYIQTLQYLKNKIFLVVIITFSVLALLCIFYILYLEKNLLKPFSKLKGFAQNIAVGNYNIPLTMDKKNLFGAFTESFDIMREELETARKNEFLANRSKKELIASLSHDIKTPVSSIKAVSELMLVLATEEKEKQRLNTIFFKAEQINLLVNDMFQATLEELEELKVTVKDECSTILKSILQNANYLDKITYDPIPECIILTDSMRLQQVFDNVLSNSYKYANTPIYITFHISTTHLEVYIIDYGKGVLEDELPLLFNKFHRGSNAEGQTGSGLGLYISKYLMEKMSGDIVCQNEENGFKVALKIKLS